MTVRRLYHYTCGHGLGGVVDDNGEIRPHPQMFLGGVRLVWFTSLSVPVREDLGLTSHHTPCDRLRHRFVVDDAEQLERCVPWATWKADHPERRIGAAELETGRDPGSWWVAETPTRGRRDRRYRGPRT